MYDQDEVPGFVLNTWHRSRLPPKPAKRTPLLYWLDHTPGGSYYWTMNGNIWFEREEDRALFVLTWG